MAPSNDLREERHMTAKRAYETLSRWVLVHLPRLPRLRAVAGWCHLTLHSMPVEYLASNGESMVSRKNPALIVERR